jgi:hypothetical protein
MSAILVKMPVRPDRQRVLVGEEGSEEDMRLRQWANKKAFAEGLAGEEAAARRDELMREAVGDAGKHGLTFMDKPIPFDEEGEVPSPNREVTGEDWDDSPEAYDFKEGMKWADPEDEVQHALGEKDPKPPASKPVPTGQTSLEDFAPKSFDPHPGDAMLKAVRARMGW